VRAASGYEDRVRTRTIGNDALGRTEVGAIGLGLMTFDQTGTQPREQLAGTVRAALDAGVTLFDSADAYGPGEEKGADAQGENERLIASLLDELGVRDRVLLATKGGHVRTDGGGWDTDSSAAHLREAVDASLARLGVDQIALWQHHRPDPKVPYDEVIGTLKEIADSGKVRMIGLSNADPGQIRAAHAVLGDVLVSVQNQFSPAFRSSRPEIDVCEELGLAFLPWSPLGGLGDAKDLAEKHPAFAELAKDRGVSPQQVALAWELAQSPVVIPIPGAKRPQSIADSAAAADLDLTAEEVARLDEG
jgi:aryl-alcohol dehydrogenase-like predicted oxidoreductase